MSEIIQNSPPPTARNFATPPPDIPEASLERLKINDKDDENTKSYKLRFLGSYESQHMQAWAATVKVASDTAKAIQVGT